LKDETGIIIGSCRIARDIQRSILIFLIKFNCSATTDCSKDFKGAALKMLNPVLPIGQKIIHELFPRMKRYH